ncbi:hypothetical protein BpHYR1_010686 [Brachionus plicatilis]|uniref:Uncharacterized protein n=1 Tax=Brachionus plicatilis TaxID=10195 RepID=A0A3M7SV55_BRAPC|nr:hypothetical protein BpHYR1_010686 [Brachionus plicatilis]
MLSNYSIKTVGSSFYKKIKLTRFCSQSFFVDELSDHFSDLTEREQHLKLIDRNLKRLRGRTAILRRESFGREMSSREREGERESGTNH